VDRVEQPTQPTARHDWFLPQRPQEPPLPPPSEAAADPPTPAEATPAPAEARPTADQASAGSPEAAAEPAEAPREPGQAAPGLAAAASGPDEASLDPDEAPTEPDQAPSEPDQAAAERVEAAAGPVEAAPGTLDEVAPPPYGPPPGAVGVARSPTEAPWRAADPAGRVEVPPAPREGPPPAAHRPRAPREGPPGRGDGPFATYGAASVPAGVAGRTRPFVPAGVLPAAPPAAAPASRSRAVRIGALVVAVALGSGLLGGVVGAWVGGDDRAAARAPAAARQAAQGGQPAPDLVRAVAGSLLPVVVQIEARGVDGKATGAGVIIRQDGYVLTGSHVVAHANTIQVTLPTAEPLKARLVGSDPETDLAVVKIGRRGLPVATFGRSADLRIGDVAIAVGSPFGFRGTVTAGIVSALHRVVGIPDGRELVDAIQTDAAINPGNSGGALANASGQVIGINSAIATAGGGVDANAGIGFAIPIDDALAVANLLIARKKVHVPYLGILTEVDLTPEVAQHYRLGGRTGALVTRVLPSSPAASAGLRKGDLVVRLGDVTVRGSDELKVALRRTPVGRPVPIVVVRRGTQLTRPITPVDQPRR
jgi:putative serine protease PepD